MPFGNINTFYIPEPGGAVGSGGPCPWGNDVQRFLDVIDPDADTTTGNVHSSNSNLVRVFNPFNSNQQINEGNSTLYGWALHPTADMNSLAGALRAFPAGDHTLTVRTGSWGLLGSDHKLRLLVYKVAASGSGYTRTQLGSTGEGVANALGSTVTVTVTLPEIVFEPGESIQYTIQSQVNTSFSQNSVALHLGTSSAANGSEVSRVETPGLLTIAATVYSLGGNGSAQAIASSVLPTVGSLAASSQTSGLLAATASQQATAGGAGQAAGALSAVVQFVGEASGASHPQAVLGASAAMQGRGGGAAQSDGGLGATAALRGVATGDGTVSGFVSAVASMQGLSEAAAAVQAFASSVAGTTAHTAGAATVGGGTSSVLGTVGEVEVSQGGGETVIRKPIILIAEED